MRSRSRPELVAGVSPALTPALSAVICGPDKKGNVMTSSITRRSALGMGTGAAAGPLRKAKAARPTIRIGGLTDLNGPNANGTGMGSVTATHMAAEDFMKAHPDIDADIRYADYQSKPDVAQSIARGWFDTDG